MARFVSEPPSARAFVAVWTTGSPSLPAGCCGLVVSFVPPPELRTMTPDRAALIFSDSDFDVSFARAPPPDSAVERSEEIEAWFDPEDDPGVDDGSAEDDSWFDSDELEESDVEDSSAQATAGVVAIAPLIPRATARAPMRPMYLAYEILAGLALAHPGSASLLAGTAGSFLFPPGDACSRCSFADIVTAPECRRDHRRYGVRWLLSHAF
jgi:hypothetical protein